MRRYKSMESESYVELSRKKKIEHDYDSESLQKPTKMAYVYSIEILDDNGAPPVLAPFLDSVLCPEVWTVELISVW
jgi:hypothetical protein